MQVEGDHKVPSGKLTYRRLGKPPSFPGKYHQNGGFSSKLCWFTRVYLPCSYEVVARWWNWVIKFTLSSLFFVSSKLSFTDSKTPQQKIYKRIIKNCIGCLTVIISPKLVLEWSWWPFRQFLSRQRSKLSNERTEKTFGGWDPKMVGRFFFAARLPPVRFTMLFIRSCFLAISI